MTYRFPADRFFISPEFRLWIGSIELHNPTIDLHTHEFWELVIIQSGQGRHRVEQVEYPISEGDVFVINSTIAHGFEKAAGLLVCNILFEPDRLPPPRAELLQLPGYHALFVFEPYFRNRSQFQNRLRLNHAELRTVTRMIDAMKAEFSGRQAGFETLMLAQFNTLVVYLSRLFSCERSPETHSITRLGRVVSYMESHYAEPIRLDDLVTLARMSKNHLLRIFRECYRTSPIDYLIRVRLAKACELMQTERSLTEIAFAVGFSDGNYFSRIFHRVYGQSPSAYRHQARLREETRRGDYSILPPPATAAEG